MAHVLLIDSYDSFSFNLAALCINAIPGSKVHIIHNDDFTFEELRPHLKSFDAIVVGPGPGSPTVPTDIGVIPALWQLSKEELLPIFGVCLGMQSLGVEHGAKIQRLNVPKHGILADVKHNATHLFGGLDRCTVVRYHSLHVTLEEGGVLEELAYVDDGAENGHVVMGVRHTSKPFSGVQYHPESVKTGTGGLDVLSNFWRIAQDWSKENGRVTAPWTEANQKAIPAWPNVEVHKQLSAPEDFPKVASRVVPVSESSLIALCESVGAASLDSPFVFLDSAGAEPGRFSIIGCLHDASTRITFKVGDDHLDVIDGNGARKEPTKGDAWAWISTFMRGKRYSSGAPEVPFWGGLIGFISYEIGVRGLDVSALRKYPGAQHPDISLVFVDRSLVYDKEKGVLHIQSLLPADDAWLEETASTVTSLPTTKPAPIEPTGDDVHIVYPDMDTYVARVKECQEYLKAGESYELCLTAQTTVTLPPKSKLNDSWELYKAARARNPAPHSAYMRLAPSTLVSTSPERFLSFSRPPHTILQLRPIKGTVRKTTHPTRASAESALAGSVKEVAENLMIVDLIRHDLHHVVGANVDVPHFCVVEEYETVWQMVSVIEGRLAADADRSGEADLGWEVLRYSLPPGSMTGAPKKRSVDILQTMEDQQRDIYSGSFGYWDVAGGGDWAVCIRSTFKHDDEAADGTKGDTYKIGAGGAVTALSDPVGEWEEMVLKLGGIIRAFE